MIPRSKINDRVVTVPSSVSPATCNVTRLVNGTDHTNFVAFKGPCLGQYLGHFRMMLDTRSFLPTRALIATVSDKSFRSFYAFS